MSSGARDVGQNDVVRRWALDVQNDRSTDSALCHLMKFGQKASSKVLKAVGLNFD